MNRCTSLHVRPDVAEALAEQRPVVALESTLIVHGLPWPLNLETAQAAEEAVRAEGAVPATIAIWEGRPTIGLNEDELDQLPEFAYNEILAPPPLWTSAGPYQDGSFYVPVRYRKRLGERRVDITPGMRVRATDGDAGRVDQVEVDPSTGELDAFWIRADGVFGHDIRVPAEWVERADENGIVVKASKLDIETRLGPQSRALAAGRTA